LYIILIGSHTFKQLHHQAHLMDAKVTKKFGSEFRNTYRLPYIVVARSLFLPNARLLNVHRFIFCDYNGNTFHTVLVCVHACVCVCERKYLADINYTEGNIPSRIMRQSIHGYMIRVICCIIDRKSWSTIVTLTRYMIISSSVYYLHISSYILVQSVFFKFKTFY